MGDSKASVTRQARDSERWYAWAGDVDRLRRVARAMDGQIQDRREEGRSELRERLEKSLGDQFGEGNEFLRD
jgi:hypothetical protein